MPCIELFEKQDTEYKNKILPEDAFIITIEAGITKGWEKITKGSGISFGIDEFGKSAPYKNIYQHFSLTSGYITDIVKKYL